MNSQTGMSSSDPERDLFKLGKIESDANYWAINNDYPAMGSYDATPGKQTFAGAPAYDIASYASQHSSGIGGAWRLPTQAELNWIKNCTLEYIFTSGGGGYTNSGGTSAVYPVPGILIKGVNDDKKANAYDGNAHSDASVFIPAAGDRNGTDVDDRGNGGGVWSGTLYSGSPSSSYYLGFSSGYWGMYDYDRYYGFSVRPVSE